MGNQSSNLKSFDSIENLSRSSGVETMSDITNNEFPTYAYDDIFLPDNREKITASNVKLQRNKSYVRPENRVLPNVIPNKALRRTNFFSNENFETQGQMQKNLMDQNFESIIEQKSTSQNQSFYDSGLKKDFKRYNSLDSIYGTSNCSILEKHNYSNEKSDFNSQLNKEIIQYKEKYRHSLENLDTWTDDISDVKSNSSSTNKAEKADKISSRKFSDLHQIIQKDLFLYKAIGISSETDKKKSVKSKKNKSINKSFDKEIGGIILKSEEKSNIIIKSVTESMKLDFLQDEFMKIKYPKKNLKSKSFKLDESSNRAIKSFRNKLGSKTVKEQKNDIEIISKFPINSKIYRHYIAGGNIPKKFMNEYHKAFFSVIEKNYQEGHESSATNVETKKFEESPNEQLDFSNYDLLCEQKPDLNDIISQMYDSIQDFEVGKTYDSQVSLNKDKTNNEELNIYSHLESFRNANTSKPKLKKENSMITERIQVFENKILNDNKLASSNCSYRNFQNSFYKEKTDKNEFKQNKSDIRKPSIYKPKHETIAEERYTKKIEITKERRKSSIEMNNQRLNEVLQREIQRAYEERTKRFNQVKTALRTNSISSDLHSKIEVHESKAKGSYHPFRNERNYIVEHHSIKIPQRQVNITADQLPSPPILPLQPYPRHYSISSNSSILPPPPDLEELSIELSTHQNKLNDKLDRYLTSSPSFKSIFWLEKLNENCSYISYNDQINSTDKFQNKTKKIFLFEDPFQSSIYANRNIDPCLSYYDSENFILKPKPEGLIIDKDSYLSSSRTSQMQKNIDAFKTTTNTNNNCSRNRRRALSDIFPEIKTEIQCPFIVPVSNKSYYESISRYFSNKKIASMEDKSDTENETGQLDHLTIKSLDWCPASDLGDFDSDDCETKSTNLTCSVYNKKQSKSS